MSHINMSANEYALLIKRYRRQHSAICRHFYLAKVQLVDNALLVAVLSNLFVNIFSVGMIVFEDNLNSYDQLFLGTIFLIESLAVGYGCRLMIGLTGKLHASAGYLHLATVNIKKLLKEKLKMMSYYEVVHSRNRLCFAIGSFIKIDKEHFLSSFFLYFSYVFYVGKIVRNYYK